MSTPALEFLALSKSFFGVQVLKSVSFTVPDGAILGLVGENGAGKSTLMNILGGNLAPDSGAMRLEGSEYAPHSAREAAERGIAFIHQELNLFPNLTVAENLFLDRFPQRRLMPFLDRSAMNRRAAQALREVGLQIESTCLVETLSAGERQLVEIAKALNTNARLMIFDEPTTSLTVQETEKLFALVGRLRTRGIAVIYISHTLRDIFQLCDHIVVLRDGEVAGAAAANTFTPESLISLMVGRSIGQLFPERAARAASEPLLELRKVSGRGVRDISLTIKRGEILGIAGLLGAGRSELARVIFGLERCESGEILLAGTPMRCLSPRERISQGMAFLTEDRRAEGLCFEGSVAENIALAALSDHARTPARWLIRASLQRVVRQVRDEVRLDAKARETQTVRTLSGGNQQKVVLAKWLLKKPELLLLDEPTRGVDVGAKHDIYLLINDLAERGAGILLISSDWEELLGLCDRILIMKSGQIAGELPRDRFRREDLLSAAVGAVRPEAADA